MKKSYILDLAIMATAAAAALAFIPTAWADRGVSEGSPENVSESAPDVRADANQGLMANMSVNYTNIFYGPSIGSPSAYQPSPNGELDRNRPVFTKNYLSLAYSLNETMAVTGTMYWHYRPVLGQQITMQDPFARVSHAAIYHNEHGVNVYSDLRMHFGVTDASRQNDFITGFQNFNLASWQIDNSRFTLGLRSSIRYNFFGRRGVGNDIELYVAPEMSYQLTPTVALTSLYEMGADHAFGDRFFFYTNDGTDFQPGVSWDVTPNLMLNPYLNIFTGGRINARSTSVGMFLSWNVM